MTPRRLALAALLLVAILVLLKPRRIPTAAEITAMDEPTFQAFLDRIGMTRRVAAALDDDGSWEDEGLWSRVAGRMVP